MTLEDDSSSSSRLKTEGQGYQVRNNICLGCWPSNQKTSHTTEVMELVLLTGRRHLSNTCAHHDNITFSPDQINNERLSRNQQN
jgi:hypothetical protein